MVVSFMNTLRRLRFSLRTKQIKNRFTTTLLSFMSCLTILINHSSCFASDLTEVLEDDFKNGHTRSLRYTYQDYANQLSATMGKMRIDNINPEELEYFNLATRTMIVDWLTQKPQKQSYTGLMKTKYE